MRLSKIAYYAAVISIFICSCENRQNKLPILGNPHISNNDTTFPTIGNFSFVNQDSVEVTNTTFRDHIYVADFIFLSCPTICPVMTKEMKSVYDYFASNDRVLFISHTIDPKRDDVGRLKEYTNQLGIKSNKWHFVTGDQNEIYELAKTSYFSTAYPDSTEPGGFVHSAGLLLVDNNRHIRGVYNGTNNDDTKKLISDIQLLLNELE